MATTGMATVKTNTIPRTVRTRGELLFAMSDAGLPEGRWLAGVKFQPRDCRPLGLGVSTWYCVGDDTQSAGADCVAFIEQQAFDINDALRDVTMGLTGDELRDLLEQRHNEMLSWAFAATLTGQNAQFEAATPTISFVDSAHAPDAGYTGVPITKAIAILENDLAETLHGAQGIIHMAPGLLHQAFAGGGLIVNGADIETITGTKVVGDAGYYGAGPPTGQAVNTPGTNDWVYASGPIEFQATPLKMIGDNPNDYTLIRTNKVERMAQSWGIFLFDPCTVTAVLATY